MALTPTPVARSSGELGGTTILQLQSGIAWRQYLRRAKFGDAEFYVDTGVRDSGRRIVQHEFPKRDVPYAEDMGRKARDITVRGYCIVFPSEKIFPNDNLKKKNYIPARDKLITALETEWPNGQILQMPLLGALNVVCQRYRITEEDKLGGYCVFDMTFNEYGQPPSTGTRSSPAGVYYLADNLDTVTQDAVQTGIKKAGSGAVAMIPAFEVNEGARIASLAADMLLATSNNQIGRAGSDLRRACGDMKAHADIYIITNVIGPKLSNCFAQARITGATADQFNRIREAIDAEAVTLLVAVLIQQACVCFSLQQMSIVLTGTTFTSREDVEAVRDEVNDAFDAAEEVAADEMAQATYMALISLHAAVTFHLYETARPLPQMLDFEFAAIRPTLIQSYRLYADASRADELREENKVVHPAFAPRQGRALSF